MTDKLIPVLVPLVNPNEIDSLLAALNVREGQKVKKDEVIAEFETTKSTFELTAEADGFFVGLKHQQGDLVKAGTRLGFLVDDPGQELPRELESVEHSTKKAGAAPADLRITQPALALAREKHLQLENLPKGELITEEFIRRLAGEGLPDADPSKIIIYGGGGHAKSLIDLIRSEGKYQIEGILDDNLPVGQQVLGVPLLGGGEQLTLLRKKGIGKAVNAVGGIGGITPRLDVYQKLADQGFSVVTVVHPLAYIEPTAVVAEGCQLFYHAYIGSESRIGFGVIINTGAIISHDCVLHEYVNISPGAILAGAVEVGPRALIGMGVTINLGVKIGAGARVGNSAVVKADVPENGVVRAGTVWPPQD